MPLISVVTPSYQQGDVIETTLRSIVGQDYPRLEAIVMDAGSSDGSVEVIQRFAPRLAYWQSQPDDGQAAAIRDGFERSTGDILAWVNSDDLLLPGALAAVARWFGDHPEHGFAVGHALALDASARPLRRWYAVEPTRASLLFGGSNPGFAQPACFFRRSAYEAVGGVDGSFEVLMDVDLYLRLASRFPVGVVPAFLAAYRKHPNQKSVTLTVSRDAELARIRAAHGYASTPRLVRWLRRKRFGRRRHRHEARAAQAADTLGLEPEAELRRFLRNAAGTALTE